MMARTIAQSVLVISLTIWASLSPSAAGCDRVDQLVGGCASVDAGTDGQQVDLHGEVTTPGTGTGTGTFEPPPSAEGVVVPPGAEPEEPGRAQDPNGIIIPRRPLQPRPVLPEEAADPVPAVSIDDLASFVPDAGPAAGEPAGWGIVGLETNFYAGTDAQVIDGELLGRPAAVRFTPRAWHWDYGDGARTTTSTPWEPWGSGTEFVRTPTSHRYGATGTFDVRLTVEFGAEFRFAGGDWLSVAGTVTANVAPLSVRIGTADTVLVERGCGADSGPGC